MATDYKGRLTRILAMLSLIRTGRHTPQTLAEHFGVTDRTIHRDRETLEQIGIGIVFDTKESCYRIVEGEALLPAVALTAEETLALAAVIRGLEQGERIPQIREASSAVSKLLTAMPGAELDDAMALTEAMAYRNPPAQESGEVEGVHRVMLEAIDRRVKVDCIYEPVTTKGEAEQAFLLEPWALFFIERAWYVVGKRSDRDEPRTLKLSRFSRARLTEERAHRPEAFSLDAHLGNAWRMMNNGPDVRVRVRFEPAFAATAAETRWHRTQEVEEHDDGSATLSFTVAGLDEIQWWVLSMGPGCTVLEPKALADRVRHLALETAAQYEGDA